MAISSLLMQQTSIQQIPSFTIDFSSHWSKNVAPKELGPQKEIHRTVKLFPQYHWGTMADS